LRELARVISFRIPAASLAPFPYPLPDSLLPYTRTVVASIMQKPFKINTQFNVI